MSKCLPVLLLLASFGVSTVVFAQEITVSGTTVMKKKPEIATFHLSISGKGKSGDKAQQAMLGAIETVQTAINNTRLGVSTLGYSVTEDTVKRKTPSGDYVSVLVGFIATTIYRVQVNELAQLPKALEMTSLPGVSKASSLEFDLRDRGAAEREARQAALKDAMANAAAIANIAGKPAFKIVKIQQNQVELSDLFGEIKLPMDSIRTGGKEWDEDGDPIERGVVAALVGPLRFNESVVIPGEMEITTSVVIMVKLK